MSWDWNVLTPILLLMLVMVICVALGRLHPDHKKRSIRRSIRLGWPLALGITLAQVYAPLPMFKPSDDCDWRPEIKATLWKARQHGVAVPDDMRQAIEREMLEVEGRCLMTFDCALYALDKGRCGQ